MTVVLKGGELELLDSAALTIVRQLPLITLPWLDEGPVLMGRNGRPRQRITLPGHNAGVKPASTGRRYPPEPLSTEEALRLFAVIPQNHEQGAPDRTGIRDRALLTLLWRTGLRISEALDLRCHHVDAGTRRVTVLHGKRGCKSPGRAVEFGAQPNCPGVAGTTRGAAPNTGGSMRPKRTRPRDTRPAPWQVRFWRYVPDPRPEGCWEWQGCKNEFGYGYIRRGNGEKGNLRAHRASYILAYGSIPDGAVICHRCDNRACVNPAHLFVGSQGDNLRDMVQKGREGAGVFAANGGRNAKRRYTDEDIRTMRTLAADGESYAVICERYGTTRFYLSTIVRGGRRRDAGGPIRG